MYTIYVGATIGSLLCACAFLSDLVGPVAAFVSAVSWGLFWWFAVGIWQAADRIEAEQHADPDDGPCGDEKTA